MTNRHQRRAEVAAMRREMFDAPLLTYLVEADAKLDHEPLLAQARTWWRANIKARRPMCIGCKAPFAEGAEIGLFLFSTASVLPTTASVSAFCCKCAREKSPADIERAALRILRKIIPGGSFHPEDAR